jgi:hypothetical protein
MHVSLLEYPCPTCRPDLLTYHTCLVLHLKTGWLLLQSSACLLCKAAHTCPVKRFIPPITLSLVYSWNGLFPTSLFLFLAHSRTPSSLYSWHEVVSSILSLSLPLFFSRWLVGPASEASPHPRWLKCDIQISPRRLIHIYYIRWYITVQTSVEAGTRYRR